MKAVQTQAGHVCALRSSLLLPSAPACSAGKSERRQEDCAADEIKRYGAERGAFDAVSGEYK